MKLMSAKDPTPLKLKLDAGSFLPSNFLMKMVFVDHFLTQGRVFYNGGELNQYKPTQVVNYSRILMMVDYY